MADQRGRLLDGADELLQHPPPAPRRRPAVLHGPARAPAAARRGEGRGLLRPRSGRSASRRRRREDDHRSCSGVAERGRPGVAAEDELEPLTEALHLRDPRHDADRVEGVGAGVLGAVALGDGEHELVGAVGPQRRLDGAERLRPPGRDRRRDREVPHRVPQRDHRERDAFGHVPTGLRAMLTRIALPRSAQSQMREREDGERPSLAVCPPPRGRPRRADGYRSTVRLRAGATWTLDGP